MKVLIYFRIFLLGKMADDNLTSHVLMEKDIPGAALGDRDPGNLKVEELKFWINCRGDRAKGLKVKAQFIKW